jgi:two-component system, OmpR family, phosphate regulon sensor histidine kinase PhoR
MGEAGQGPAPRDPASRTAAAPAAPLDAEETCALLAVILEQSSAGVALLVGDDLRFVIANPAYRALTPQPDADPVGHGFLEIWPGADEVAGMLRGVLASGAPFRSDDHPVRFAGATRWFSFQVTRVAYGRALALLAFVWETTAFVLARTAAEDGLQHALRRAAELDAAIDAIADGFVLYGPGREVLRMNAVAAELLSRAGVPPGTSVERTAERLVLRTVDGRPLPLDRWPVARALAGETVTAPRLQVEAPGTGRSGWVLASAAPVRQPGGGVAGAVLTFSDETEHHALEEARDDLVRMISHDLRTPLQAVSTQAHLLQRSPGDPTRVQDRAASIARSCDRMTAMIQDLVETTLLEAGQLPLATVPLDLAATLPEVIERHHGALDVDRIRLSVAPGVAPVQADPPRLERVVVNLLSNALKYSPPPTPVDVELAPAPGGCRISVSDRGVGISPEDQAHVFDRFYRARGQRRPEGLGLGLYITRLLVEAHGGRIDVESSLGCGSTFRVFLPGAGPTPPPGA